MRAVTALMLTIAMTAGASALAQTTSDDQRALREQIERRYDVVPLSNGVALRPRAPVRDVRLIEVTDGAIIINGTSVTGRELRDQVGATGAADAIVKLSFLAPEQLRALFAPAPAAPAIEAPRQPQPPLERTEPSVTDSARRSRRSTGDRVRVFGDVKVDEDEEVTGEVVAVLGSARIDGEVGGEVVAVLGSIDLGPKAVVGGDVVSVGGRVHRSPGAETRAGVTEVALTDQNLRVHLPWFDGSMPFFWFGSFGALPRLIGSGLRTVLLLLLTGIALVIARRSVEATAERVSVSPVQTTLIGLVAEILIGPVLVLSAIVLAVSLIGIPLLLLLPFVVLLLILMSLVGFTGTAAAIGRAVQRRFGLGGDAPYVSVFLGVLVILSPLLFGRLLALAGWPATPFALLLIGAGFAVELLAWACGLGAMLANTFRRWQAHRSARYAVTAPPATP